jgi:hypothetical protein
MAVELSVRWWKANEPKMTKHMEWEKDVVPALASWESSKKNVDAGTGDMTVFYTKLLEWGDHLKKMLQAKHDWLNRVAHGETRKKIDELLALLDKEMAAYAISAKALEGIKSRQLDAVRTPNTGRPLPKRPPAPGAF